MIKFEHSVFALPFALTAALLAARYDGTPPVWPTWRQVSWIIVAMVGARSAAMTMNRIADLRYDALNPRTAARPLVTGALTLRFAWVFTLVSSALLVLAAWQLNLLALKLSPAVLALFFFILIRSGSPPGRIWSSVFVSGCRPLLLGLRSPARSIRGC